MVRTESSGNIWKLDELDVIGYADSLTGDLLPRVVAPIYTVRSSPVVILMPPFGMSEDVVILANRVMPDELARAVAEDRATVFQTAIPARVQYLLWIDADMAPHYESAEAVRETMRDIAKRNSAQALVELQRGELSFAARLAQTAVAADEKCLNAILVKALIQRRLGQGERVALLREVARRLDPDLDFDSWIDAFDPNRWGAPIQPKFAGLALERAA